MEKKVVIMSVVIVVLAAIVVFFVLRDFGFLGAREPGFRGGTFDGQDMNSLMPRIKSSLGLPADATDAQVAAALNLPNDANFEQIRNAFLEQMRTQGGIRNG